MAAGSEGAKSESGVRASLRASSTVILTSCYYLSALARIFIHFNWNMADCPFGKKVIVYPRYARRRTGVHGDRFLIDRPD
jgi:hypothetical protein